MSDEANTNEAASVEAKVELTVAQKIAALEARIAKLRQSELTEQMLTDVAKDDKVTIKFGRGEKVRNIEATVVAVSIPNVVVLDGELNTYKINVRDIIANSTAADRSEQVVDVEEISDADGRRPEEAGAVDGDASADPLENA